MPAAGTDSTVETPSTAFSRGQTIVSVETFVNEIVGTAAERADLVELARKAIDKSTPRMSSRSGGKKHPRARLRETCLNFFSLRIQEMKDNGHDACIQPLLAAKGGDVLDAARLLYGKLKGMMAPPNARFRSTTRSRVEKYFGFYAQSGTEIDRALAAEGAPSTNPGDLEVYSLAKMLGIVKTDPYHRAKVIDTTTTRNADQKKLEMSGGLLGSIDNPTVADWIAGSAEMAALPASMAASVGSQGTPRTAAASSRASPAADAASRAHTEATTAFGAAAAAASAGSSRTNEGMAATGLDGLASAALAAPPATPTSAMQSSAAGHPLLPGRSSSGGALASSLHLSGARKRGGPAPASGGRPRLAAVAGAGPAGQGARGRGQPLVEAPARLMKALKPLLQGALTGESMRLAFHALALADFGPEHEEAVDQVVVAARTFAIVHGRGGLHSAHQELLVDALKRLEDAVLLTA